MDQAGQANVVVRRMVETYLKEIDVPTTYVDRIMAVDSGDIEWLTRQELEQHFDGYAPAYRDWIVAKCTPASVSGNERLIRVLKGMPVDDGNFTPSENEIIEKYFSCSHTIRRNEVDRLWGMMFSRQIEAERKAGG